MKEISKKIIAIIFTMLMIVNSSLLTLISVAIEEIEKVLDESKISLLYEINLEKYVNYQIEESKGTLVQFDLKMGVEYDESQEYTPLKATSALLNLPKIENEFPESIDVIGKSTKATNGSDVAKDFQYVYNKENGEIKLVAINQEDEDGNIYSEKVDGAKDEYTIICYYSSNCYSSENIERNLEISGFIQTNIENDIEKKTEINQNYNVKENISGLISTFVKTSDIYNGYLKSNSANNTDYKTEYVENLGINISKKEISDEIKIDVKDSFVNKKDQIISTNDIVYKSTRIDKNKVLDILGEDGYLQILNENGDVLREINKDTEVGENNIYEISYDDEKDIDKLIIKTSKPLKVGNITIENTKEIKETMTDIENNRIKVESDISCINNIKNTSEENTNEQNIVVNKIYDFSDNNIIEIKDSETRVDLSIDKLKWINSMQNEVTMTVKLISNNIRYNLFDNPVIDIKLPSDVDKIIIDKVSLLYEEDLKLEKVEIIEQEDSKIIRINLNGVQKKYTESNVYEGAYIIIPAIIILKNDITSCYSNIEMTYSNGFGDKNDYSNNGLECKNITITEVDMNDYNVEATLLASIENDMVSLQQDLDNLDVEIISKVGNKNLTNGDIVYEKQIITYKVKISNNSDQDVNNVKVIAKVPDGATYVEVNVGNDDENIEKRYEYVKKEDILEKEVVIPQIISGTYEEFYFEVEVDETSEEREIKSEIKVFDNNNSQIYEYNMTNVVQNAKVYARLVSYPSGEADVENSWGYTVIVDNYTDKKLDFVNIDIPLPKYMKMTELSVTLSESEIIEQSLENNLLHVVIDSIDNTGRFEMAFYIEPDVLQSNVYEYNMEIAAKLSSSDLGEFNTNLNRQKMYTRQLTVEMTSNVEGKKVKYDEAVEYDVIIKNRGISLDEKEIVINVQDHIPSELLPESIEYDKFTYNEETGKYEKELCVERIGVKQVTDTDEDNEEVDDDEEDVSTDIDLVLKIPNEEQIHMKIKTIADMIYETKDIENNIVITYMQDKTISSNIVKTTILKYDYKEGDDEEDDSIVDPDDDIDINEDEDDSEKEENETNNSGSGDNSNNEENNENNSSENKPDQEENQQNIYSISGQVWVDLNRDGKKDNEETKLSNVIVKLFDADTNSIVAENNKKYITQTDNDGKYSFEKIGAGKYLVLFEYDNKKYNITEYQKSGIAKSKNSDVISKEVNIDGTEKNVAVTDFIVIKSEDINDIDMGLVEGKKYDLSLNKYVKKIKVKTSSGTKEYDYDNSKLAKVEIPAKEINNAVVDIEYKFVVKNEGDVEAYVSEITDYLPKKLIFSQSGNWIKSNDGYIKNTSLSNIMLKPGESKEIYLSVSADGIGIIENVAEITKSKNELNLSDVDSTENNKNKSEDDYSSATVIISIKTGIIFKISIIIILLFMLAILFIIIKNNKDLAKKIFKYGLPVLFICMFVCISTIVPNSSNASGSVITKTELREKLKEEYTTSETITVNSNKCITIGGKQVDPDIMNRKIPRDEYDTFATNSTSYDDFKNTGVIHCTNASKYMCGGKNHYYKQQSVRVTITEFGTTDGSIVDPNEYSKENQTATQSTFDNTYDKIGPFKIKKDEGNNTNYSVAYSVYNNTGTKINNAKLCNSRGDIKTKITVGSDFYFKVPKNTDIGKVTVIIKDKCKATYNYKATINEKWECYDVTAGIHKNMSGTKVLNCSDIHSVQPGERVWEISGNKELENEYSKKFTFNVTDNKGSLTITKVDADNHNTKLNAKFKIVGTDPENNTYSKEIETTDGKIELKDLTPGKYKITETKAPSGVKLNLQASKNIDVTINNSEDKEKIIENKKYSNLKIIKAIGNKNFTLKGVKFVIYYYDDNGNKKYIGNNFKNGTGDTKAATLDPQSREYNAKKFETDSDGETILLENIPIDTYYIHEVSIPEEYKNMLNMVEDKSINTYCNNLEGAKSFELVTKNFYTRSAALQKSKEWSKSEFVKNIYSIITGKKLTNSSIKNDLIDILGEKGGSGTYKSKQIKDVISKIFDNYLNSDRKEYFENASNDKRKSYINSIENQLGITLSKPVYNVYMSRLKGASTILIYNQLKVGHLIIKKNDADTGEKLKGAKFNIKNGYDDIRAYNKNHTVGEDGELAVDNLPIGEYTVTEVEAPAGYKLNLQKITQWKVTIKEEEEKEEGYTTIINIPNRQYGDMIVEKIDKNKKDEENKWDADEMHKLENLVFNNVEFKVYYIDPKDASGTLNYISNYIKHDDSPSEYRVTNESGAQIFKTGTSGNGKFELKNLPKAYVYYVQEVNMPDALKQYYDVSSDRLEVHLQNNNDGTKVYPEFINEQKRFDLEGYVWEDKPTSKNTLRNDLWIANTEDIRVKGISVYLKKNGKRIAKRTTDSDGRYFFPAKGDYEVDDNNYDTWAYTIDIADSNKYSVEFEYNGLKYESVLTHIDKDNGSKAKEYAENRKDLNEKFSNIYGGNSKNSNGTQGYAGKDINLTYKTGTGHNSLLVEETSYSLDSVNKYISPADSASMLADTKNAGFSINWKTGVRTIRNINFGIYKRPQADMAIASDIDNIQLTINGYKHTYNYKDRKTKTESGEAFSVDVKYNSDYKNKTYVRDIYDSYIAYTKNNTNNDNKLKVFVTYYIVVKNEGDSKFVSRVSLNNYADIGLINPESYYEDNNNRVPVTWEEVMKNEQSGYKKWRTKEQIDKPIKKGESITIYLKYELNTDTIVRLANLERNGELIMKSNVSEINSYTTWDESGALYGTIDKDSAPNNIEYGNIDTYEDDTDAAPNLKFKRKDSREVSGFVFEDNPIGIQKEGLNSEKERKGNGQYNEGENIVENAEVRIVMNGNNQTAKLYNLDDSGNVDVKDAKNTTGADGISRFVGLVPGEYYMQYRYGYFDGKQTKIGNINVTTESYKSTIITHNIKEKMERDKYWYKEEDSLNLSSAVDNYKKREKINRELSDINYSKKSKYDNNSLDGSEIYCMDANTGMFDFPIEDTIQNYQTKFGIIERPKQSLELNKEISYVRIVLANGQVLVEGDPRTDTIKYVTYPDGGILKIEIDNEIIQGAGLELQYEISVTNKSEIDYDAEQYYKYGYSNGLTPVKIKLNSIVDYVDEKLSVTYDIDKPNSDFVYYDNSQNQKGKWMIILDPSKEPNKLADKEIDPNVYNLIKKRKNIVVRDLNGVEILPNETKALMKLSAMKLLTDVGNSDQIFDNYVELLGVTNPIGRFYGQMSEGKWQLATPGNFNVYNPTEHNECDNNSYNRRAQATIVPPTGAKTIIIYSIIGVICLVILSGGIILIKKKVL